MYIEQLKKINNNNININLAYVKIVHTAQLKFPCQYSSFLNQFFTSVLEECVWSLRVLSMSLRVLRLSLTVQKHAWEVNKRLLAMRL